MSHSRESCGTRGARPSDFQACAGVMKDKQLYGSNKLNELNEEGRGGNAITKGKMAVRPHQTIARRDGQGRGQRAGANTPPGSKFSVIGLICETW